MQKVIVANVDGLASSGSPRDAEDYRHSVMAAQRQLFSVGPDDIVILPALPNPAFLDSIAQHLGYRVDEQNIIVPPLGSQELLIWSYAALADPNLHDAIRARAVNPDELELWAFCLDRPVMAMADAMNLRLPKGARADYFRAGGVEAMNSKVAFREVAGVVGAPLAPGCVVSSPAELAAGVSTLIRSTGSVIVKQDVSLGGVGNIVITLTSQTAFPGARIVHSLPDVGSTHKVINDVWRGVAQGVNTRAVIETYYSDVQALCCEMYAHGPGGGVDLLNFGEMLMDPVILGLDIHGGTLGEVDASRMTSACIQVAAEAGRRGFHGFLNVDSLLTSSGDLYLSELNGRMGGCTHIHELASRLLGPRYQRSSAIISRSRVASRDLKACIEALDRAGLLFDPESRTGVVVVADGTVELGLIEYVVIAESGPATRELDRLALHVVEASVDAYGTVEVVS